MAAILKLWRQIDNPTPSVDAYLHQERIWNDGAQVEEWSPQQEQQDE